MPVELLVPTAGVDLVMVGELGAPAVLMLGELGAPLALTVPVTPVELVVWTVRLLLGVTVLVVPVELVGVWALTFAVLWLAGTSAAPMPGPVMPLPESALVVLEVRLGIELEAPTALSVLTVPLPVFSVELVLTGVSTEVPLVGVSTEGLTVVTEEPTPGDCWMAERG